MHVINLQRLASRFSKTEIANVAQRKFMTYVLSQFLSLGTAGMFLNCIQAVLLSLINNCENNKVENTV